jgi:hypothetical protein
VDDMRINESAVEALEAAADALELSREAFLAKYALSARLYDEWLGLVVRVFAHGVTRH